MVHGLDVTDVTKDFSINVEGKVTFLSGKDRTERNWIKMIKTQKGPVGQLLDSDERYNPLYGTRLDEFQGYDINQSVLDVKSELESVNSRFIKQQDNIIDFMEEDEYIVRAVPIVAPYKGIGIYFVVDLYTAKDIRLQRNPSIQKQYNITG